MRNTAIIFCGSFFIRRSRLEAMVAMQSAANSAMNDKFSDGKSDVPYYRASVVESVEAIQHFGYKWWKSTAADIKQVKMELIDILHFALSDYIELTNSGYTAPLDIGSVIAYLNSDTTESNKKAHCFVPMLEQIGRFADGFPVQVHNSPPFRVDGNHKHIPSNSLVLLSPSLVFEEFTLNDLCEQLIYSSLKNGFTNMMLLYALFEKLNMTEDEVFGLYVGKNALNHFRTENGQKENQYCKMWDGEEDNEHLTRFIETCVETGAPITLNSITGFLEETYANASVKTKA